MEDFRKHLESEIAVYEGRHDDLIYQVPAMYDLLVGVLDDPELPERLRPLILSGIAYFFLPADVVPEEIHGPKGYLDDLYLTAQIADVVREEVGEEVLLRHWTGEAELLSFIDEVQEKADAFLEEGVAEEVLEYVGYQSMTRCDEQDKNAP